MKLRRIWKSIIHHMFLSFSASEFGQINRHKVCQCIYLNIYIDTTNLQYIHIYRCIYYLYRYIYINNITTAIEFRLIIEMLFSNM